MQFPDARLLVFTKAPVPGQVKTRLIPSLGAGGAAALQAQLIRRTVDMASAAALAPVELWCSPDDEHSVFQACRRTGVAGQRIQQGSDLGQRMYHALDQVLAVRSFAVLIGSDCPSMNATHLQKAMALLNRGVPAVLGPAEDGGYVLLGLRQVDWHLFAGVDWSTSEVLAQTRARLRALERPWEELEPLWDLDRPEDLERMARESRLTQ